jgi:hypothetical protein
VVISPQKRTSSSQKLALPTGESELLRTSGAAQIGTPLWPISGLIAEDWRAQRSVAVGQRVDSLFPGSSGVSSASSFSFQSQSFEGIALTRREPWGSSNRDFSSGARRRKMSQQNRLSLKWPLIIYEISLNSVMSFAEMTGYGGDGFRIVSEPQPSRSPFDDSNSERQVS